MTDLITQIADLQVKAEKADLNEELNSNIVALNSTIKDLIAIMAVSGREITPPTAKTEVVVEETAIEPPKPAKKKRASRKKKDAPIDEVIVPEQLVIVGPEKVEVPQPETVVEPVKTVVEPVKTVVEPAKLEVSQPETAPEEVSVEMVNESILAAKARGVNLNQARAIVEQFGVGRVLDLKAEDRLAVRNAVMAL